MAELVDALVSNTSDSNIVPVRPRPWVQQEPGSVISDPGFSVPTNNFNKLKNITGTIPVYDPLSWLIDVYLPKNNWKEFVD